MKQLFSVILVLVLVSCSDDNPTDPPEPPIPCDTCGTELPLSVGDSIHQLYPRPLYTINYFSAASNKEWCAGSVYLEGWQGYMGVYNNFILNLITEEIKIIPGAEWIEWSQDGRKLLVQGGGSGFGIYDLANDQFNHIVKDPYIFPVWSLSEDWIYMMRYGQTYKVRPDGTELTFVADSLPQARQLNDSLLIAFETDALYTFNLVTEVRKRLEFSEFQGRRVVFRGSNWDLSPDRTKILADIWSKDGIFSREDRGLYLYDLKNESVRKVLKGHYWGTEFVPRWSSNSTFFATYFCRKDSAAMVYEFDLNGKTLRQMTFKEQRFYP